MLRCRLLSDILDIDRFRSMLSEAFLVCEIARRGTSGTSTVVDGVGAPKKHDRWFGSGSVGEEDSIEELSADVSGVEFWEGDLSVSSLDMVEPDEIMLCFLG